MSGQPPPNDRPISQWEAQPELPPKIVKLITRKPLQAGAYTCPHLSST